ncbi:MAG: TonB-dependent receptor plug domain-containing protein [Gammaproteobacteria bacterium]
MSRSKCPAKSFVIRLLPLALTGMPLSAAENVQDGIYQLGEIVVQGEQPGVEAIASVYQVSALDIERKAARTLDEAIELLPGVNIRTGDGTPRIDVRGFKTRQVKLLLNGVPFNSSFDAQFDPTLIPTESIAKIKLTSGASSELYGEGGEAAVINIITKKGASGFKARAAGEVGDRGHQRSWGSVAGGSDNIDCMVSLSHQDRDGFPLSDDFAATSEEDGGLRDNSDRRRTNVYVNAGLRPNDDWSLGLSFNHSRGAHGIPGSVIDDKKDVFASSPKYERVNDEATYASQFTVAYDPEGPWASKSWAYLNVMDERASRYDDATFSSISTKNTFELDNHTQIAGVHNQTSYDHDWGGSLTVMADAREERWEQQGFLRDKKNKLGSVNENRDIGIVSTAVELTFSPIEHLGIALGYGHHWLLRDDDSDDASTFVAGAHYNLPTDTRLHLSAARKIKIPSINQLYDVGSGDPTLQFEHSFHYEAGAVQQLPGNSEIRIVGFLTDVSNHIEKDNDGIFRNFAQYEFQGIEIAAQTYAIDNLMLRTGYTF